MSTQVRRVHERVDTDRMGSGFGGERQGQEIVDAAVLAGTQSATSRNRLTKLACGVIPLCSKSGAGVQCKELMRWIQSLSLMAAITFVMYFRVFYLEFTGCAGAESCRPRERLTDQLLIAN